MYVLCETWISLYTVNPRDGSPRRENPSRKVLTIYAYYVVVNFVFYPFNLKSRLVLVGVRVFWKVLWFGFKYGIFEVFNKCIV